MEGDRTNWERRGAGAYIEWETVPSEFAKSRNGLPNPSIQTLNLTMVTAMFAETFENIQHSTWPIAESRNYRLHYIMAENTKVNSCHHQHNLCRTSENSF